MIIMRRRRVMGENDKKRRGEGLSPLIYTTDLGNDLQWCESVIKVSRLQILN